MNPADIIGYVLIGVLLLATFIGYAVAEGKLDDPNDTTVIHLERLPGVAKLTGNGRWLVRIIRQSGNVHSESEITGDASAAVSAALATFRRAKIGEIGIPENTESKLRFGRLYHNHRGSNEGKKVGSAHIERLT